ncbi:peptidase M14, carboxypeptidase A, partial [Neoconidiobolus thromboides FSU 785]
TPKKKVYFESLIHAREWITGSTLQYVLNHLITNRQSDPAIKSLLDQIEIIAVPVVNPDGYAYTWSGDRLWRKNRRSVTGGVGIDLNRNFPYGWGGAGASTSPSSETYRGPSAASESETQAIVNYFKSQGPFLGAIDFHSYSQLILRPYGTTQTLSPHEAQHKALGEGIKQKIAAVAGTSYINERSIDLYACSGTASDWFYAGNNQKTYGYTIELSPDADDPNGFVLPPESIIPVAQDITPAVIYFLETVLSNPL